MVSLYPVRRKRATFRNWTVTPFGIGNFRATPDRVYRVPIYFSGSDAPTTSSRIVDSSRARAAVAENRQQPSVRPGRTGATGPRLSQLTARNVQASGVTWTAVDFEEIYVGPSSVRTKMAELRAQKFLDWQLHQLDVLWMSYNGDSGMFVLNRVS